MIEKWGESGGDEQCPINIHSVCKCDTASNLQVECYYEFYCCTTAQIVCVHSARCIGWNGRHLDSFDAIQFQFISIVSE